MEYDTAMDSQSEQSVALPTSFLVGIMWSLTVVGVPVLLLCMHALGI
jgi:hypothetical protein